MLCAKLVQSFLKTWNASTSKTFQYAKCNFVGISRLFNDSQMGYFSFSLNCTFQPSVVAISDFLGRRICKCNEQRITCTNSPAKRTRNLGMCLRCVLKRKQIFHYLARVFEQKRSFLPCLENETKREKALNKMFSNFILSSIMHFAVCIYFPKCLVDDIKHKIRFLSSTDVVDEVEVLKIEKFLYLVM